MQAAPFKKCYSAKTGRTNRRHQIRYNKGWEGDDIHKINNCNHPLRTF